MVSSKFVSVGNSPETVQHHRSFENYKDLIYLLVQKEIKVRYKNKFLGYLWSIASPLASAIVYYFAFGVIMSAGVDNYPLVLICGLFPWQWFGNSVGSGTNLFVGNAWLIKKVNFPRNIIPLCMVTNHMIHFVISIPVIVLFLLIYHQHPTLAWLYGIPILLVIHFIMTYSIALILASLNLFFRDLERLTSICLSFLFFLTPILYPLEMLHQRLGSKLGHAMMLNPATPLIISWKQLFLGGTFATDYALLSLLYGVIFFIVAHLIYRKLAWRFAEVI